MMSAITTAFERSGTRLAWIHGGRRALQRLFDALELLVPPPHEMQHELPDEWFKYPPI